MKNYYILCLSLLLALPSGIAQAQDDATESEQVVARRVTKAKKTEPTRTITGRVISHQGKAPLSGVLVQSVAGTGYSALTEEDGTFKLEVPVYGTSLSVTIPGYNTVRVGINKSGNLGDITMQSDAALSLYGADDNVLGVRETRSLEFSPAINVTDEIGSQLGAYVRTVSRGGTPGIGNYLQIAGVNSFSSNAQPLVVVDGIIIDQNYAQTALHEGFYNDFLNNININDIESVKVLTNGSAIYGAKGGNGVILINTKRNKSLATRIEAVANVGVETMPASYGVMNGAQFKSYAADLLQGTGTDATSFRFLRPATVNGKENIWFNKYNNNTNWGDQVYRSAITQNYGINVQGGGEVANYMLSLGYTLANSTLKGNDFNRLNIRFNTDIKIIPERLSLSFDAAYTDQTRSLLDNGTPDGYDKKAVTSLNFLASAKSPMLSPYGYARDHIDPAHLDVVDEDYLEGVQGMNNSNYRLANPAAIIQYGSAENKNYFDNGYLSIRVTPRVEITKNIFAQTTFSYILANTNEKYYIPMNGVPDYYVAAVQTTYNNEISSLYAKQQNITSDTRFDWHDNFGAHAVHVMGGFRFLSQSYDVSTQKGYNTGNDKLPFINNTIDKVSADLNQQRKTISWYAQGEYNYANRYYLEGSLAMESNSQFGPDAKSGVKIGGVVWGIFPSIQAGWVMSNEKWFNAPGINYLKLTAGYNLSGNDDIYYDARRSYFSSVLFSKKVAGITLENIGNSSIQWETTRRFNAGLEMNAVNNRLGFRFNYFHSWTDNLLTLQQMSFVSDVETWGNSGSLKNQGFDATLTGHLISGTNWNWTLGASVGHYVNTLTSLPNGKSYKDTEIYGATIRSQVGGDINTFWGYRTNGVYATTAEAKAANLYIEDETGKRTYFGAGDVRFVDVNKDGKIDSQDKTNIGSATPDIYGNIFTSLSWKSLRLDVNFNYSLGGSVFNYARQQLESGSRFMNQTTAMLNRWSYEGQKTNMPKATYEDPMGNARFSDRWIEDGSYLRLRNVTLSYKLPINNTYIQGITVWAQGNNLFCLTKYLGIDPDVSAGNSVLMQGIDNGRLARGRSFNFGVKINL